MTPQEKPLPRSEVPDYIENKHGKAARIEKTTLSKMAVVGGGPEFCRFGRRVAYFPSKIDEWIDARRSSTMRSTSDISGYHVA